VPARGIGKEHAPRFLQAAFAIIQPEAGTALPDAGNGEPAAALATPAAYAGCRWNLLIGHTVSHWAAAGVRVTAGGGGFPGSCRSGSRLLRFPHAVRRHRAAFRHKIPFAPAQGLSAEVTAGGRPLFIDDASPSQGSAAVGFLFLQVPARGIGKEHAPRFLQAAFAEIVQLVGFALPDQGDREPAAALAAPFAAWG